MSKSEISLYLGQKEVSGQLNKVIRELLIEKRIELTIPDKPNSRLQKYRLTKKSTAYLRKHGKLKIAGEARIIVIMPELKSRNQIKIKEYIT